MMTSLSQTSPRALFNERTRCRCCPVFAAGREREIALTYWKLHLDSFSLPFNWQVAEFCLLETVVQFSYQMLELLLARRRLHVLELGLTWAQASVAVPNTSHELRSRKLTHGSGHSTITSTHKWVKTVKNKHVLILTVYLFKNNQILSDTFFEMRRYGTQFHTFPRHLTRVPASVGCGDEEDDLVHSAGQHYEVSVTTLTAPDSQ